MADRVQKTSGLKYVQDGPAATFKETINDNFDKIRGVYVGPDTEEARNEANQTLNVGGLWIVTKTES